MTTPLPDAMVEAAARALYEDMWRYDEDDPTNDLGPWEELDDKSREGWRRNTHVALAAALSAGELHQRWRDYDTVSGGALASHSREEVWSYHYDQCVRRALWDPPPNPCELQTQDVYTFTDGSVYCTPWVEVSTDD